MLSGQNIAFVYFVNFAGLNSVFSVQVLLFIFYIFFFIIFQLLSIVNRCIIRRTCELLIKCFFAKICYLVKKIVLYICWVLLMFAIYRTPLNTFNLFFVSMSYILSRCLLFFSILFLFFSILFFSIFFFYYFI